MKQPKSLTTQDFNRICRFCAKPNNDLKLIFKSDDTDTLTGEKLSFPCLFKNTLNLDVIMSLRAHIKLWTNFSERQCPCFQVIVDERLPLLICTKCSKKLTNANDFRKQCLRSYQLLIEICENEAKRRSPDTEPTPEVPSPPENADVKTPDEAEQLTVTPVKFFFFSLNSLQVKS